MGPSGAGWFLPLGSHSLWRVRVGTKARIHMGAISYTAAPVWAPLAEPGPDPVPCDNRGTGAMGVDFRPYGRGWWGARRTAQRPHDPTAPMTSESARSRLALLHHIQDHSELLTLADRFALLAGALPDDPLVRQRWEQLASALILAGAV